MNSRILGLAILRDGELMDHRVRQFQDRWSPVKAVRIISCITSCIRDYTVTHIAVSLPYEQATSKQSNACLAKILALCDKRHIPVKAYDTKALHNLCGASRIRQKALMLVITSRFPELRNLYRRELKNKRPYYCKVFEAVAVANIARKHF